MSESVPETRPDLAPLRRAVTLRERWTQRVPALAREYHDAGYSYVELARVLGVTRQSVREMLTKEER